MKCQSKCCILFVFSSYSTRLCLINLKYFPAPKCNLYVVTNMVTLFYQVILTQFCCAPDNSIHHFWSLDPRVTLQSYTQKEYTIKIQNVNVYDEGLYTCAVQTNHFPRTTFIHVIVQVPPKIRSISSNISVSEGDNVTLKCLASGKPEPEVTWKHLSAIGRMGPQIYLLMITSITRHDSGLYECKAVNDAASVAQRVEVTVNFPPYISDTKNEGVPLGYKGTLHCEAVAMPIAKFEWYRDQRRILNKLNGVQIQNIGRVSMLTLFNVSEEDYGNYTCVAINKLGSANASINFWAEFSFKLNLLCTYGECDKQIIVTNSVPSYDI
uniref:Neurotrimin-like n=1 Tax=Erpetoichthys calabaricus TaxID=27687 RepID=A0A8C4TF63_ERPCA